MTFQTYTEAVNWITSRISHGIKPGLTRMQVMLEKLGHPERRLKFIHVAGTNGKGSTCAFLTSALRRAGYDVGTFTSPYIMTFNSRMRYNGENILDDELVRLCNQLAPLVEELEASESGAPTMFEVSTVLAILYYATVTYPDYVVWETGLGGRLDSTNVVSPVLSVITNVGHDHMDILGDTLEKIMFEKAGIIKPGVPVVSAVEQPGSIAVLEQVARDRKSSLYLLDRQFTFQPLASSLNEQSFDFSGPFRPIPHVSITMNGFHQCKNAAVALMAIEVLRQYYALVIDDEDLYAAFRETAWEGRLELLPGEPPILLDGAHNPEGAETLARALRDTYRYQKLHLLIGMLSTKHHTSYLEHILPVVDTLIVTEPDFRKKLDAPQLAAIAEEHRSLMKSEVQVITIPDWKEALEQLKKITGPDDLAVVTGTLYLISDVRSWILRGDKSDKGW